MNTEEKKSNVKLVSDGRDTSTLAYLLKKIFLVEILKGLKLTFSRLFTKPVTRRYPKEKRPAMPGFRGLHGLVRKPDSDEAKCVGCGLCAALCPSQCIHIFTREGEEHEKIVERYEIEVLRCLFCAFCVEACPYEALVLTEHYEYSDYSREALYMTKDTLLENWDKYMGRDKNNTYFKRFWRPREEDFTTPKDQAVFTKE